MIFRLAVFDAGGRQVGAHMLDCGDHVLAAAEAAGLLRRSPEFRHATLTQQDRVVARFPGPIRNQGKPLSRDRTDTPASRR